MYVHKVPYVHVITNHAPQKKFCWGPKSRTDFWILASMAPTQFTVNYDGTQQHAANKFHNVFTLPQPHGSDFIKDRHQLNVSKYQKSVELMKEFINRYSFRGQWVLDPFMGTGTTGMAALALNRYFLGCDINRDIIPYVKQRFAIQGFHNYSKLKPKEGKGQEEEEGLENLEELDDSTSEEKEMLRLRKRKRDV